MLVESRRDEFVDLRRHDRKRDEGSAKQRELQLGDEIFQQRRVDELRILGARHPDEWPDQHVVDLLGEEEAEDEGHGKAEQRLDQPRAQLDQVIHQRRLAGLDVFGAHDALASFGASTAGAGSCGAGWVSRTMASGSLAAAWASASTKVCGVGAAGSVGVTGSPMAPATCASAGLSMVSASVTSFFRSVMTLAPEKLVAASLTSSKLFLMSAISASRKASWNWPWNSAAILRALPIHWPTMRSTPGNSFGPMAISATTAMTTSSLHPMSNMKESAHAQAAHNPNSHSRI